VRSARPDSRTERSSAGLDPGSAFQSGRHSQTWPPALGAVTPDELAHALADRIQPLLPAGMTLLPSGSVLYISVDAYPKLDMGVELGPLRDYNVDGRLEPGQVLHIALSVLDDVQEVAVQLVGDLWPDSPDQLPTAAGKIVGGQVLLWYGDESAPAAELAPLLVSAG